MLLCCLWCQMGGPCMPVVRQYNHFLSRLFLHTPSVSCFCPLASPHPRDTHRGRFNATVAALSGDAVFAGLDVRAAVLTASIELGEFGSVRGVLLSPYQHPNGWRLLFGCLSCSLATIPFPIP